jgi:signal transduction histidine kinase
MTSPAVLGTLRAPRGWLRLPRRTIRLRMTLLYAALFLLSGAVLLTITYLVVADQTPGARQIGGGSFSSAGTALPAAGAGTGSVCFSSGGPPSGPSQAGQCATIIRSQVRAGDLQLLLVGSGVALGIMTVAALGLGWVISGRALRPLRTITWAARNISDRNLHERLALRGPDDELKELGDTVDGLLARLESAFAAQRQFVANASHELRSPLARQRTLVEVALADPGRSVESLQTACERVLAAGQQQERLIEALLTLARSQRGLDHFEQVDLSALTRDAARARAGEAAGRDVRLSVAADGAAVFCGDARLAERLVANLVDNAIRHNVTGGEVVLRAGADGAHAVLTVANTGPAIPGAEVAGLFAPFRRGGAHRTGHGEGLGLGLSIVSAIVAAHGGDLRAVPRPGGGLDIQVRFWHVPVPVAQPAPVAQAEPVTISPSMPGLRAG